MAKITDVTFNFELKSGSAVIARDLTFENGDKIAFTVSVPDAAQKTISTLHKESAELVISLLQEWIKPAPKTI